MACWDMEEASGSRVDHIGGLPLAAGSGVARIGGVAGFATTFVLTPESYLDGGENLLNLVLGNFTLACWVRLRSVPEYIYTLAAISHADIAAPREWPNGGTDAVCPRRERGTVVERGWRGPIDLWGRGISCHGQSALPLTSNWALLTAWREEVGDQGAVEVHIQLDNGSVTTGTGVILSAGRPTTFSLGAQRSAQGTWLPFHGDIDTFMVWTRVLSAAERTALWQGGPS